MAAGVPVNGGIPAQADPTPYPLAALALLVLDVSLSLNR